MSGGKKRRRDIKVGLDQANAATQQGVTALNPYAQAGLPALGNANALLGKIQQALTLSRARYAAWLDQQTQNARLDLLTPKERTVVRHVLEGMTSREISHSLDLSVRTVENHRARIMEKLHVESTVDLVKLFK